MSPEGSTDTVSPIHGRPPGRWIGIVRLAGLLLGFTALAAPLILLQIGRSTPLSIVDELTYVDYLYKVDHGQFVIHRGETLGSDALHEVACRGGPLDHPQPDPVKCALPFIPPAQRNTADIDPPTYYVLTDLGTRLIRAAGITGNLVTAGRLVGIVWAGLGLLAVYLVARSFGARVLPSFLAALAALVSHAMIQQWQYVTPHALDLPVGGLVTLLVVAWDRQKVSGWALVAAGLIPPLVKAPQVLIVGMAAVFLLLGVVRWQTATGGSFGIDRRRLLGFLTLFASLVTGTIVWLLLRRYFTVDSSVAFPQFMVRSLTLPNLLGNISVFLRPWSGGAGEGLGALVLFWCYGNAAAAAVHAPLPEMRRFGFALLLTGSLGALLFVMSNFVLVHQYVDIPLRYGFSLVPAALGIGALALRTRTAQLLAAGLCTTLGMLLVYQQ